MGRLEGKIAFVTGGAGGIGSATVRRFVEEGAKVAIADLHGAAAQALADEIGDATTAFAVDIADEQSFKSALDATVARFGRLDILFNNAALVDLALLQHDSNVVDVPNAVWDRTMQVNVNGYLYGCRHAIPLMAAGGGGAIVNMASGAGIAADLTRVAYGTSKAAVISLTKYIATQHGRERIRCNAIAPGPIMTPNSSGYSKEFAIITRHMPMGKPGKPADIAALATYLAADESGYVNGQVITIDGGMSAHHAHVMDLQDHVEALAAAAAQTTEA